MGTRTGNPPWQNRPSTLSPVDAVALTNIEDALDNTPPLDSPEFTGTPTAPQAPDGSDDYTIATTNWVNQRIGEIVPPEELATAVGAANNPHTSGTDPRNPALPKNFYQCPTQPTTWLPGDEWILNA